MNDPRNDQRKKLNVKKSTEDQRNRPSQGRAETIVGSGIKLKRWMLLGFIGVAAIGVGLVFSNRNSSNRSVPKNRVGASSALAGKFRFAVGQPAKGELAPNIVLPSTTGKTFDLSTYRGKGVLLYFQEGIGCQPCWDQMRDFTAAKTSFDAVGVDEFVTITVNPVDLLQRKMKQENLSGLVLADTDLRVSKLYHANDFGMMGDSTDGHSFVFVDKFGVIQWRADYGGSPDFTMYVPPANLLADLKVALGPDPQL
jgi:peroxiredoxin